MGECVITKQYVTALNLEARSRIIGGGITLGSGAVMTLTGIAFLAMIGARPNDPVDEDTYWLAGSTLLGVGLMVAAIGALALGLGLKKRRRWRQYTQATVAASPGGFVLHF
jgi:hypothetical protein